ncbi:MAG TPA: M28 family peptidase [Gemmatimonadales bacterium]|nr:M28 family peptidase [Gemmatimonadales bacterium]
MTERHALLAELAMPRRVGSEGHARARDVLKRELERRGLVVLEHRFRAAVRFPLWGVAPADGLNLIAVRPQAKVHTWLAAHYDSKGQPISMATRLLLAGAVALALLAIPFGIWIPAVLAAALFLVLNRVTNGSPGALDNASGVLTVLATLDALPPTASVGALLLDAEELGLVGARALAHERANLLEGTTVINFDGIDDTGAVTALVHRPGGTVTAVAMALGAGTWRRLPVVVDGMALAPATRECVTIMKGNWHTMRIVHTPRDQAERLNCSGVVEIARILGQVLSH